MNDKEKLIELFEAIPHAKRLYPDLFVDYLIENGVRVVVCNGWIEHEIDDYDIDYECPICGVYNYEGTKFCPNCGNYMREKGK